jgi:hypothetical protein
MILEENSMARHSTLAFALALGIGAAAFAATPPTVYEDFSNNTDTYWTGVGNRTGSDNYGWSELDTTGTTVNAPSHVASGGGELGGAIHRGSTSQYGFDIGAITSSDVLHADGVYKWSGSGSGQFYFGFYNSATHAASNGDPRNFVGIELDDSHNVLQFVANGIGSNRQNNSPADVLPSDTIQWSMDYNGAGKLVTVVNGVTLNNDAGSGYFFTPVTLDRFGLFPSPFGDSDGGGAFDDITFSSLNPLPVPEPASLGVVAIFGLALARRRRVA